MNQITQETRDKLCEIFDRGLCHGAGKDPAGQVCLEQAIAIAYGDPLTDSPSCVHPAVAAHSRRLNDANWSSPKVRADSLRAYALNQLGCSHIDGREFAKRVTLRTIREILPIALRAAKLESEAKACETAEDLKAAGAAARKARAAAAAADAAADAYAAAADADAAAAAAAADAAADAAAAYAADAAAYAAYARSKRDEVLQLAAKIADEVLTELLEAKAAE